MMVHEWQQVVEDEALASVAAAYGGSVHDEF